MVIIWLMVNNNCSQCASASNPYPIWLVMVGDVMVPMVGDSAICKSWIRHTKLPKNIFKSTSLIPKKPSSTVL